MASRRVRSLATLSSRSPLASPAFLFTNSSRVPTYSGTRSIAVVGAALLQGRQVDLPLAEALAHGDLVALVLQRAGVHVGHDDALGERAPSR